MYLDVFNNINSIVDGIPGGKVIICCIEGICGTNTSLPRNQLLCLLIPPVFLDFLRLSVFFHCS